MAYGEIIQVIGPSVDIRFPEHEMPRILNAVKIEDKEKNIDLTLEVAQHIGNDTVRCIALASTDGLVRGMKALDTGKTITVPVGGQTLGRIFNLLGTPIDNKGALANPDKRYSIHRDPPSFEEPKKANPASNLKRGILWLAVGLAVVLSFVVLHKTDGLILGIVPAFIGAGYLLVHFLDKPKSDSSAE